MTLPTSGLITVNDRGARAATTFGSVAAGGGNMVFIKKLTASSSGTLSFVNGASSVVLDSTYKEYLFTFNLSADSGSNYNVTKTTSFFEAYHNEGDSDTDLAYAGGRDLAQSTAFQQLNGAGVQDEDDGSISGYLQIFDPSSTTFVKHFISSSMSNAHNGSYAWNTFMAGYGNTTSAIDAVQFKMSSGNIDAGDICLYGIL